MAVMELSHLAGHSLANRIATRTTVANGTRMVCGMPMYALAVDKESLKTTMRERQDAR